MKKLYTLLLFSIFSFAALSQTYENSWINYSQEYYKIKVWQDGIHRIYNTIAGTIPFSNWKAANIQLYHNGVEQFIYVYDKNQNGIIDGSEDYIEYYGEKNDGSFDTQ